MQKMKNQHKMLHIFANEKRSRCCIVTNFVLLLYFSQKHSLSLPCKNEEKNSSEHFVNLKGVARKVGWEAIPVWQNAY